MDSSDNMPGPQTPHRTSLRARVTRLASGPKTAKVAGLTMLRVLAALASLISVMAIVRLFPADAAGEFFVFLTAAQFVAGATLGPLLMLSIRFGAVHKADGDREALGRLILFGGGAIVLVTGLVFLAHPLVTQKGALVPGEAWVFAAAAGLGGAVIFLGALARVNDKVIGAVLPENVLRPAALALAATLLWVAGAATFPALSAAYCIVLLAVGAVLALMAPWRAAGLPRGGFDKYRPYLRAYGPLAAYGLVSTALTTFDILIVSGAVSVEAVPAYKAAIQYAMLLTTGVIFANLIYGPQIAIAHAQGDLPALQRLARSSSRLALGFYALAFAPLLTGPFLFELAFGEAGQDAWSLALILCAGRFMNAWFGSVTNIANLTGYTTLLALMQGGGVALLIGLGTLLGEHFGAIGVAIASALAMSSWAAATSIMLQQRLKLKMGPI